MDSLEDNWPLLKPSIKTEAPPGPAAGPAIAVFGVPALAVRVIFAPGTIAPDSSVTMPRKVPVCANKADEKKSETMRPSSNFISQVLTHSHVRLRENAKPSI